MTSTKYAITADRIWDGMSDVTSEGNAIIVNGESIEDIVPLCDLPRGIITLCFENCTILPGLIDMHVHYSAVMGPSFLAAGVTTVRDTGNDLDWILTQREKNAVNPLCGPDIHCCGFLVDGFPAHWPTIGRGFETEEHIREMVRMQCERGVDYIKLYVTLTPELFQAAVDEAHVQGKWVLAHLGQLSAQQAAEAGVDEIEHLTGCESAWNPSTVLEQDLLIDVLLDKRIVLVPTIVVWDRLGGMLDPVYANDSRLKWVHPTYRDIWKGIPNKFAAPEARLPMQAAIPHMKRFILRAHERGIPLPVGTDSPWPYLIPGFSMHDELSMYVDAGISPVDALFCATSQAARILKKPNIGSIAAGMKADLTIVAGNPLEHIQDISNVRRVVHAGVTVDPDALYKRQIESYDSAADEPKSRELLKFIG